MSPAFPELVAGREDDVEAGPWRIEPGSALRGGASCDLVHRVLEVPGGPDPVARVVRAHELMHARVSPHPRHLADALDEVTARSLECAEELRVNTLLARMGFDVSLLVDGSERSGGERIAHAGDWPEAVCFAAAVAGTGAERTFVAGIRRARPEWVGGVRAVIRAARARLAALSSDELASTRLDGVGRPAGFVESTLCVARIITRASGARAPTGADELRRFRRGLSEGGRRPPSGRFADLVIADGLEVRGAPLRTVARRRARVTGLDLRYPERLVTDPLRRAFVGAGRRRGGVVVIDQSGSMALESAAVADLARHSPGALVLSYSHLPGDRGLVANAWILARDGRVAESIPAGNVGNGVDGPALRWALSLRRCAEPMVWVTDGQVTDSNDHADAALALECAALVRRYRITLVRSLTEAGAALQARRPQPYSAQRTFGRVGTMIPLTR